MGRPRTPTALLESRGAFTRHPERRAARANEPKENRPLGECPHELNDEQAKAWVEIVENSPARVLTQADRHLVEIAARALASLREPTIEIVTKDGTVITVAKPFDNKAAGILKASLVDMGMTPVGRSKVQVPKDDGGKSPFDQLM